MPAGMIRVRGLREVSRAFSHIDSNLKKDLRTSLRAAAEPVRREAESLASTRIRNIGGSWSRVRVGVTQRLVYAAPREKGARGDRSRQRPNLAVLLHDRAYEPALEHKRGEVIASVDHMLDSLGREAGF